MRMKIKTFVTSFNTEIINKISKIVRDLRKFRIKLTQTGEEVEEEGEGEVEGEEILKELKEIKKDTLTLSEEFNRF